MIFIRRSIDFGCLDFVGYVCKCEGLGGGVSKGWKMFCECVRSCIEIVWVLGVVGMYFS